MFAEVEQSDGSYITMDMVPPTGCFYCDTCGDCLSCDPHDDSDWCSTGGRWVVYLDDPFNPAAKKKREHS